MKSRAYMNHGRWVAECASPKCANAWRLSPGRAKLKCELCGASFDVEWPGAFMKKRVEEILNQRPNKANRNWFPEESLEDLIEENREHGV